MCVYVVNIYLNSIGDSRVPSVGLRLVLVPVLAAERGGERAAGPRGGSRRPVLVDMRAPLRGARRDRRRRAADQGTFLHVFHMRQRRQIRGDYLCSLTI